MHVNNFLGVGDANILAIVRIIEAVAKDGGAEAVKRVADLQHATADNARSLREVNQARASLAADLAALEETKADIARRERELADGRRALAESIDDLARRQKLFRDACAATLKEVA